MSWVRISDDFSDGQSGAPLGVIGRGLFVDCVCYSNRNLTDGWIPDAVMRRLLADPEITGQGEALLERLERGEFMKRAERKGVTGWLIIHYHRYQPSKQEVLEKRQQVSAGRAAAGRRSGEARRRASNKPGTKREQNDEQSGNKPGTKREQNDEQSGNKPGTNREQKGEQNGNPNPNPNPLKEKEHRARGARDLFPAVADPPNPRVISRLVHELAENSYDTEADLKEDLKSMCARHHVPYDAEAVRLALDSVARARKRRSA